MWEAVTCLGCKCICKEGIMEEVLIFVNVQRKLARNVHFSKGSCVRDLCMIHTLFDVVV